VTAGTEVLDRFARTGYTLALEGGKIKAKGPGPPPEELRERAATNRERVKAAILLSNPPPWLEKLIELWWSGHETPVRRTDPATGQAEVYMVSVTVKNIAAAVAAEIGMDPLRWEERREEVEEALGSWDSLG
jgi:hypothetical protein